jgi:hypothetical protein
MSLFYVTVDTGDGYYGHAETWTAELSPTERDALVAELMTFKRLGSIEKYNVAPLRSIKGLTAVRPKILAWVKANPKGRAYGGPGS